MCLVGYLKEIIKQPSTHPMEDSTKFKNKLATACKTKGITKHSIHGDSKRFRWLVRCNTWQDSRYKTNIEAKQAVDKTTTDGSNCWNFYDVIFEGGKNSNWILARRRRETASLWNFGRIFSSQFFWRRYEITIPTAYLYRTLTNRLLVTAKTLFLG